MKPFLSIISLAWRTGGLDILFDCLKAQTYRNFELVLVDSLYGRRKALVESAASTCGFPVQHVEPIDNPFPVIAFCRCANTGFVYARGEIVVLLADYTWIPPDFLAGHARRHREGIRQGVMSPVKYTVLPRRKKSFRNYGFEELDPYLADLTSGKLDDCLWSIFRQDWEGSPEYLNEDPQMFAVDQRRIMADGPIPPTFFNAKCESFPLADALAINGFDERLDGTNGYQDSMFGGMLTQHARIPWVNVPDILSYIINPRIIFPHPRWLRHFMLNFPIWEHAKSAGYPEINTWSLREKRKEVGSDA